MADSAERCPANYTRPSPCLGAHGRHGRATGCVTESARYWRVSARAWSGRNGRFVAAPGGRWSVAGGTSPRRRRHRHTSPGGATVVAATAGLSLVPSDGPAAAGLHRRTITIAPPGLGALGNREPGAGAPGYSPAPLQGSISGVSKPPILSCTRATPSGSSSVARLCQPWIGVDVQRGCKRVSPSAIEPSQRCWIERAVAFSSGRVGRRGVNA